jgi:hypothetical protein
MEENCLGDVPAILLNCFSKASKLIFKIDASSFIFMVPFDRTIFLTAVFIKLLERLLLNKESRKLSMVLIFLRLLLSYVNCSSTPKTTCLGRKSYKDILTPEKCCNGSLKNKADSHGLNFTKIVSVFFDRKMGFTDFLNPVMAEGGKSF